MHNTPGATIKVLIGDDHRIVREGLKQVLADAPDITVCAEATNGDEVLATVMALQGRAGLSVVLLDIAMPGRDGLDVLQQLRQQWPALPVLMLSTYPEKQYAVRCIKLGAAGYLNKSADPDDMLAAVRKVQYRRAGLVLGCVSYGSVASARLLGMLVDGSAGGFLIGALAVELSLALWFAWALKAGSRT